MKTFKLFFVLAIGLIMFQNSAMAQNEPAVDSTGLPGDNFDLQGALQMF